MKENAVIKSINIEKIRNHFPILSRELNRKPLIYLDSAATSQKPLSVTASLIRYYEYYNANVHRGVHSLSEEATSAYETVREQVKHFIQANNSREIIFTANATSAINLVAYSWGRTNIFPDDEIVLTKMEHHSNLIPWQILAAERNAKLKFIELTADGELDMISAAKVIGSKTKIVAVTQMSNVLGTINPVDKLADLAHAYGALILVDGAQSVPHMPVSVQSLNCDFLAFSLHKMLGPTGVGVLWGREEILDEMPAFMGGGSMINSVKEDSFTLNELPWKFEAGTPNIADVIASGAALDYLNQIGMQNIRDHEVELCDHALTKFEEFAYESEKRSHNNELTLYGPRDINKRGGVFSFSLANIHSHDIGQMLSDQGIAVRVGHHCCQLLMRELGIPGTTRASFYIYTTKEEIDILFLGLREAKRILDYVTV